MIWLLSGPPGAGKSSVATALMQRFEKGVHIPMDDVREWVVAGNAPPSEDWSSETDSQFRLSRTIGSQAASLYADAGFRVAIADVLFPHDVANHFTDSRSRKILLLPTLEAALERNSTRTNKDFDTAELADLIRFVYAGIQKQDWTNWRIIDSTELSVAETVDAILEGESS